MRKLILALAYMTNLAGLPVSQAQAAADYPYWKLDYRRLDTTYEKDDERARRFAFFYWDGKPYCRYRSGWNGPGAYELGTRFRRGHGWDGGYPWQGPGTPADHEDVQAFAEYKADYAHDFRHAGTCGRHVYRRYHRRHYAPVLRRMD